MTWMNENEIDNAIDRWNDDPALGPAVRTLDSLRAQANHKSDGWHIWPKPARAAAKLMDYIQAAEWPEYDSRYREPTTARLRAALSPVKAFRTRMGWDFAVTERLPTPGEKLSADLMHAERVAADYAKMADRWLAEASRLAAELAESS